MSPLLANEFDASKISYGEPKTLDSGARHIRVLYNYGNHKGPLSLQTAINMHSPFGHSAFDGSNKFTIQLSFKDIEDREDLREFKDALSAIDTKLVEDAMSGILPSHNKKFTSKDVVEVLYQPLVKPPKDDRYAPTFKMNLPTGDHGEFKFPSYVPSSKTNEPILSDLKTINTAGALVTAIMTCTGIWVSGGTNFGVSFKADQLRIEPRRSKTDYAFKDPFGQFAPCTPHDQDDIDEGMNDENEHVAEVAINDHEDDNDDEEEDEIEMPVTTAAKKKPTRGKAAAAK